MSGTVYLKHPDWEEARPFPREQAVEMLKRQKLPNVPAMYRNLYKIQSKSDEPAVVDEVNAQENTNNTETASDSDEEPTNIERSGNKKTSRKTAKRR